MLLVVPNVPGINSVKPAIQGYGCRVVGSGVLSCEALFVARDVPAQTLEAQLHAREGEPRAVILAWSPLAIGLHGRVSIDIDTEE